MAGDPGTSRSGARTVAGSPATWRMLNRRGWGEAHDVRRDRQLYRYGVGCRPPAGRAGPGPLRAPRLIGRRPVARKPAENRSCRALNKGLREHRSRAVADRPHSLGGRAVGPGSPSACTRCTCAARHTEHGAPRRHRCEHRRQRPRGPGTWVASSARQAWVNRGSSLRTADSSEPLSPLLTSSSSMSNRSHTACRRIRPRVWSTFATFRCTGSRTVGIRAICAVLVTGVQRRKRRRRIKPVKGCSALIGHSMTVNGIHRSVALISSTEVLFTRLDKPAYAAGVARWTARGAR